MANLPADVRKSINRQLPKQTSFRNQMLKTLHTKFEMIKSQMIKEFNSHPVTVEIEAGPNSSNTSNTLNGYGNLFSFIGFRAGSNPTQKVRNLLEETDLIQLSYRNGRWNFETSEPTREEIFAVTDLPWAEGRSWVYGIETGLSGLGLYLYAPEKEFGEKSQSGTAIQLKGKKTSEKAFGSGSTGGAIKQQRSRFHNTSYVSGILNRFKTNILALQKMKL